MSERNTLIRSLHDVGLAAWFGGSLMGAVGVNGAAGEAKEPSERLRLSSIGWAKWTPWQLAAVAAHTVGGVGLLIANRRRVNKQPGATASTVAKLVVTVAAAGTTAYSGVLGATVAEHSDESAEGATEPHRAASDETQRAQRQLKIVQWVNPLLTGVLVVLGAVEGEQQRGAAGLLDLAKEEPRRVLRQAARAFN